MNWRRVPGMKRQRLVVLCSRLRHLVALYWALVISLGIIALTIVGTLWS